jgi:iron complex outermembrane receptor protein
LASFGPETIDDFYAGLKDDFRLGGMPGRLNIEGYYDLYHGMQTSYLSTNGLQLTTVTTNVPKTIFRGFDADLTLEPTDWLVLSANYALIDAFNKKWSDNTIPGLTGDLTSNPVAYVSKNKFTVSARLHKELPNNMGELVLAPSATYQDKFYTTALARQLPLAEEAALGGFAYLTINHAPPPNLATAIAYGTFDHIAHGGATVPSYTTVDLRAEWNHIMGSRIDGAVNVTNLTNRLYYLGNSGTLNFGVQGDAYGPPRMVTVELSTKF